MNSSLLTSALFLFSFLGIATTRPLDQGVSKWSSADPVITIINNSAKDSVFDVETAGGLGPSVFKSCQQCIKVKAGQTIAFHPGLGFNGALTRNNHQGSRHEINFEPGITWYDVDMEKGMSDETLGPTDVHMKTNKGGNPISGETNTLAKANAAWKKAHAQTKQALLRTGYLEGNEQRLARVRMDEGAPASVIDWLQLDADFNAYVSCGSVSGKPSTPASRKADTKPLDVATNKMTITLY